ncbi:MAG TPA: TIGR03808 family TAT-translocated repetitive protein [Pseudolabrys sp.]
MPIDRRRLLVGLSTGAAVLAAPLSAFGLDAAQFGVRAGSLDDQSRALQRAIDQAAHARVPLMLAPGVYRAGDLKLPAGAHLAGMRGASRLILTRGPSLLSAEHADSVALTGLVLDGGGQPLPQHRGLVHLNTTKAVRITDCQITGAGGNGVTLEECDGDVTNSTITGAADNALFCIDSRGFRIVGNIIAKSGNGGSRVWQSIKRHDGSLIADNRIDDTGARAGGTGENGNAINVFRAADVMVRGNQIRNAAFSAVRGNAASNIQILGNNCGALEEVAIYSEFDFEGALIADNVVDGAGTGISVTNFKEGGRLATVRGNILRNLRARQPGTPPEAAGVGIGVEADTAVTGNVIENAQTAGIQAGWGPYLRNVAVTGNVVRDSGIGVAVSVVTGAGSAVISGNLIAGARRGAIVGMEWHKAVTGDLALAGAERYPQIKISGNQVS